MKKHFFFAAVVASAFAVTSCGENADKSANDAADIESHEGHNHDDHAGHDHGTEVNGRVFFKAPQNGAVVSSPVKIEMGVEGMKIDTAGSMVENTGHHHLIINGTYIADGMAIPFDEQHQHFGKGQTEAEINLKPGKYKLTLQFANGAHASYGEPMSKTIEIEVQ